MKKEKRNNLVIQVITTEAVASFKGSALQNFVKLKERYLCRSLFFNEVAAPQTVALIKTRPRYMCFFCDFYKIFNIKNYVENLRKAASVKTLGS